MPPVEIEGDPYRPPLGAIEDRVVTCSCGATFRTRTGKWLTGSAKDYAAHAVRHHGQDGYG